MRRTASSRRPASLELIHTYSLIHDDLPALDNDDLRRGRPTCHKVFGDAMAILAGDALLTLAFEVLAKLDDVDAERRIRLVRELATASGTVGGMIGGQVNDMEGEGRFPTAQLLESIHRAKTGALLRASVRMGAIYAGADEAQLAALTCFGEHIGLAFQIVDDVLDVEQSSEALGKTAGKDAAAAEDHVSRPCMASSDRARWPSSERLQAHLALSMFDDRAERLTRAGGSDCAAQRMSVVEMKRVAKIRLDQLLVDRGLAESREKARALILAGSVRVDGQKSDKPGHSVPREVRVEVAERMPYVSRGGFKLAGALDHFSIDVRGPRVHRCRRVHRRIHGLSVAARRGARLRRRRRPRPDRLEASQRSARRWFAKASTRAIFARRTFRKNSIWRFAMRASSPPRC